MRLKMKNRLQRCDINSPSYRHGHVQNMNCVSVYWWLYQLSNTEAELKKSVAYKKACNNLVQLPLNVHTIISWVNRYEVMNLWIHGVVSFIHYLKSNEYLSKLYAFFRISLISAIFWPLPVAFRNQDCA